MLFALSPDLGQQATCYSFVDVHPLIMGYYADDLPNVYSRENPTSILSLATIALTARFTSLQPPYPRFKPCALSKYAECLRLLREAANDPQIDESDPFLMAIHVLGTSEVGYHPVSMIFESTEPLQHSKPLALESCATRRHRDGAIAVIKTRSRNSFRSRLSQELLMFTRAQVVRNRDSVCRSAHTDSTNRSTTALLPGTLS